MSDLLDKMEKYFNETPKEKVMEDWAKSEKYDKVGVTVEEFCENLMKSDLEKLKSIAEEMVKDLIEASEKLDNPYESIAKYYNFKQSLNGK